VNLHYQYECIAAYNKRRQEERERQEKRQDISLMDAIEQGDTDVTADLLASRFRDNFEAGTAQQARLKLKPIPTGTHQMVPSVIFTRWVTREELADEYPAPTVYWAGTTVPRSQPCPYPAIIEKLNAEIKKLSDEVAYCRAGWNKCYELYLKAVSYPTTAPSADLSGYYTAKAKEALNAEANKLKQPTGCMTTVPSTADFFTEPRKPGDSLAGMDSIKYDIKYSVSKPSRCASPDRPSHGVCVHDPCGLLETCGDCEVNKIGA
jgi:hypothetical protein